ncbi:MAG: hypothetical protein Q9214_000465 [Letrouitia sp. 1 TL-2023]
MSYLDSQLNAFRSHLTASSSKISNKRTVTAPARAAPSPTPSQASTSSKNDLKRKRPESPKVPYSQPADTGTGTYIMTQVTYAIDYLKSKNTPQTLSDIISYLSLQHRDDDYKKLIQRILTQHEKVNYERRRDGREATFSFRPVHNIRSSEGLLRYLQSQPTAQGLNARKLRDGWADAEDAINQLQKEGKLLVTRNKKDNHARMVWPNDPSLSFDIDQDYRSVWHKIKLPEPAALADELEREGLTPANKSRNVKVKPKVQEKPKRKQRAGGRTTNVHMAGVLKDYSHLKK